MARRDEAKSSRTVTDKTLGLERNRADDEVLERSTALGETAEDVIHRARDRAQRVLELARRREDHALRDANMANEAREQVVNERAAADDVLATEYADADAEILDELSRRRQAVIQLLALERDDTDRMLESERRDADRLVANRDDLLGSVSHDLRNHLSGLLVRTSFIITTHDDDAPLVSELRAMQTSIAQMDYLLGDLLDVAALDAGRLRIRPTSTDVAAVVAEEVELLRPVAESRSLSMTFEARAAAVTSAIDKKRISRVLLNVITNAIKYTPPDGSIAVLVERDGNDALISVSDTGPGIAAEQLELIFERFHRADPNERGYGLGLYIARAIVDAHGGRIWAESKLGEGSTFRIRLPGTSS